MGDVHSKGEVGPIDLPVSPWQIPAELITLDPEQLGQVDTISMEQKHQEQVERLVSTCGGGSVLWVAGGRGWGWRQRHEAL